MTNCYIARNLSRNERAIGTSGSLFYAIASVAIEKGWIVCGAAFVDGVRRVRHICVSSIEELLRLCQSKYVESETKMAMEECLDYLSNGKEVLFTGTPCQVALIRKRAKDHKNLHTIDLVCHGVPTVNVWNSYLDWIEAQNGARVVACSFRDKSRGWNSSHTKFLFANGNVIDNISNNDPYMAAFYSGLSLRQSCLTCKIGKETRPGDLTLGDAWHVGKFARVMDDNSGTSLLLVNTDEGESIISELVSNGRIERRPYPIELAKANNSALVHPAQVDVNERKRFLRNLSAEEPLTWSNVVSFKKQIKNRLVYLAKKAIIYAGGRV